MAPLLKLHRFCVIATVLVTRSVIAEVPARFDQDTMPRAIFNRHDSRHPLFLAASEVFGPDGLLRKDAPLSPSAERALHDFLTQPRADGCVRVQEAYVDYINAPSRRNLVEAIANADFVMETRVTNREYGFLDGVPGQLLCLKPASTLKGAVAEAYPRYFVFVPVADFEVGGVHFCKTDVRYGAAPAIGDTLFVLGDNRFVSSEFINTVSEAGYIRVTGRGDVIVPKSLGGSAITPAELRNLATGSRGRSEPR
jgi:hypothetical protein